VIAGFRGLLPPWAIKQCNQDVNVTDACELEVTDTVRIKFVPVETPSHLTNYKPVFMISLWRGVARDADALLYLDPDIVLNERWSYIEEWLQCGVALCEDVNSPLHSTHPKRSGWRNYYGRQGIKLREGESIYVNGGVVGIRAEDITFLETWGRMMHLMAKQIGGLGSAMVEGGQRFKSTGFADCFEFSDQDTLNAAVEAYGGPITILGQEAMCIKPGHAVLPHALGSRKPWRPNYLADAFRGYPPRVVDKAFWKYASGQIMVFDKWTQVQTKLLLKAAASIGRFYARR
jgi:hypothetical protein